MKILKINNIGFYYNKYLIFDVDMSKITYPATDKAYVLGPCIGEGSFAKVYSATLIDEKLINNIADDNADDNADNIIGSVNDKSNTDSSADNSKPKNTDFDLLNFKNDTSDLYDITSKIDNFIKPIKLSEPTNENNKRPSPINKPDEYNYILDKNNGLLNRRQTDPVDGQNNSLHKIYPLDKRSKSTSKLSSQSSSPDTSPNEKSPTTIKHQTLMEKLHDFISGTVEPATQSDKKANTEPNEEEDNKPIQVAIKMVDLDRADLDQVSNELLIAETSKHPNLVPIYQSFVSKNNLWIVMPLLNGGSLLSLMKKNTVTGFKDEHIVATILKNVLQGLEYLHHDLKIHRDVKASNILVSDKGEIKLADFGVSCSLLEHGNRLKRNTVIGTLCWMAPEIFDETGYTDAVDIWAIGITALEITYGKAPYDKFSPLKTMKRILDDDPPSCDDYNNIIHSPSNSFKSFVSKCLRKDPSKRYSAKKLLDHDFIKKAKNEQYILEHVIQNQNDKEKEKEKKI
jgi:serine/threonine protein kinase